MTTSDFLLRFVGAPLALAAVTSCASTTGGESTPATGLAMSTNEQVAASLNAPRSLPELLRPGITRLHRHGIEPITVIKQRCCSRTKTLFVTDSSTGSNYQGAVFLYKFPSGHLVGELAAPPEGFSAPEGACVDDHGNVYIANSGAATIDEYSHGGIYVATLADPNQYPSGCAYDSSTGDLAVSNLETLGSGAGSISIYNGGVIQNVFYPTGIMDRVWFLGYFGRSGVLYFDGTLSTAQGAQYASMDKQGSFSAITIHGTQVKYPGMVQWSAKNNKMVIGDSETFSAPTFYRLKQTDAHDANVVRTTVTQCVQSSSFCLVIQAFLQGSTIIEPDAGNLSVNTFQYPAGGAPTAEIVNPNFASPIGSAVSAPN